METEFSQISYRRRFKLVSGKSLHFAIVKEASLGIGAINTRANSDPFPRSSGQNSFIHWLLTREEEFTSTLQSLAFTKRSLIFKSQPGFLNYMFFHTYKNSSPFH